MRNNITFNFDLDGVCVDLAYTLAQLEGYEDPVLWFMHAQEEHGALSFQKAIEKYIFDGVFTNALPMPNFDQVKKLVYVMKNKGYNVKILSSCMDIEISDIIASQKREWVLNNFDGMIHYDDIQLVKGSSLKINFITDDNTYLIDDYTKTQRQFIENGLGDQFIFYKNFYDCLAQLERKNLI